MAQPRASRCGVLLAIGIYPQQGATMISADTRLKIAAGLADGSLVPYLGPGILRDVVAVGGSPAIPATSDESILAMNDGRPMAPKLMYEFSRAAMNVELKRGR